MPKTSMLQSSVMFVVDEMVPKQQRTVKNIWFCMRLGVLLTVRLLLEAPSWLIPYLVPHFALYDKD